MDNLKKLAAEKAVEEIESGMIVGLGTGSTFQFALLKIAEKIKSGELKNILGVPSSKRTEEEAVRLGIPVLQLNEVVKANPGQKIIDIYIDGADEVCFDSAQGDFDIGKSRVINVIKGGGGAMLREKIVTQNSKRFVCVVDESKISDVLGTKWPVPMEIFDFALNSEIRFLESIGGKPQVRKNSVGCEIFSDQGNIIVDVNFGQMPNPGEINDILNERAGIAGHGIFIGYVERVICATRGGVIIY